MFRRIAALAILGAFLAVTPAALAADPGPTPPPQSATTAAPAPTPGLFSFHHLQPGEAQAIINLVGNLSAADTERAGATGLYRKLLQQVQEEQTHMAPPH